MTGEVIDNGNLQADVAHALAATTTGTSRAETIDRTKRRALWALILLLAALLVTDHISSGHTESSQAATITAQANTIAATTTKQKEQTKAEVQLRGVVKSQQSTIANQQGAISHFAFLQSHAHANTVALIRSEAAVIDNALHGLTAFDNALGLVVIDAFHEGHLSKLLLRDLEALLRQVEVPLP